MLQQFILRDNPAQKTLGIFSSLCNRRIIESVLAVEWVSESARQGKKGDTGSIAFSAFVAQQ
jgi:hypothetical protein